jgi:hypothetical protein
MVQSAVPSAAAEEGGGTIRLNDFASAAAAQAAKDNAGRLRKAGLAQNIHLSQPEAWALAEKIYEEAAAELARGRNEPALRGFQQAADYYQKSIRLSASN